MFISYYSDWFYLEHYFIMVNWHFLNSIGHAAYSSTVSTGASTAEPQLYYIHTDHLGTPQELTDRDGHLQWTGHYRAWGELAKATDHSGQTANVEMPLRFQGQYCDAETGLHYNRHRYYDPQLGRFTTQDPISLAGGVNLYQYAPNPVQWVDPLGLSKCNPTEKYEVGTFDDLKRRSKVGDELDIHHVMQKNPAGQIITGYDPKTAPSMAVPGAEHKQIPTIKGPFKGTARDLLAKDVKDLRNYTNAPPSAVRNLIRINKESFPKDFTK